MLGKLLKYDMKSISRELIPVWILAPLIALLTAFGNRSGEAESYSVTGNMFRFYGMVSDNENFMELILALTFFAVLVAMTVLTVLFVLQRFWSGLLKEEGYLMFTLPVEPWELITSKGISATIVTCISVLVGAASIAILIFGSDPVAVQECIQVFRYVCTTLSVQLGISAVLDVILAILVLIFGVVKSIYHVYAAMALGQTFQSHRKLGACLAYMGISIAVTMISRIFMSVYHLISPAWVEKILNSQSARFVLTYLIIMLIVELVQVAVFHVITEKVFEKKLNLE